MKEKEKSFFNKLVKPDDANEDLIQINKIVSDIRKILKTKHPLKLIRKC